MNEKENITASKITYNVVAFGNVCHSTNSLHEAISYADSYARERGKEGAYVINEDGSIIYRSRYTRCYNQLYIVNMEDKTYYQPI